MRVWHYDLIECLPKSQLIAQWRELNSIFKKQDKHILINNIYNYDKSVLKAYTDKIIVEMQRRGYKIKSFENYDKYFEGVSCWGGERFIEHNNEYLMICYWNLVEKYKRFQKETNTLSLDLTEKLLNKINNIIGKRKEFTITLLR